MKPVVLVMGAGTFQVGLIRFLKKHSYEVHVITNDLTNAGLSFADIVHPHSYIDLDKVLKIAEETEAIQILSAASEAGLGVQAAVQKIMGWNGFDSDYIQLFANKIRYKDLLKKSFIQSPEVELLRSKEQLNQFFERFGAGVVLKPVTGSGSRNVQLLNSACDLDTQGVLAADLSGYLIEEYIDGEEYGGDFLVYDRKLLFYHPTVKSKNQNWVPTGHLILQNVSDHDLLVSFVEEVVDKVPLENGVYNVDIIVTAKKAYLIDLSPRIGGNCIPDLIYYSWCIDEWEFLLELLLTEKTATMIPHWQKPHGVYILGAESEGQLLRYLDHEFENQDALLEVFWRVKEGEKVWPFDQGTQHVGYVIYTAESDVEILSLRKIVESFRWFEILPV